MDLQHSFNISLEIKFSLHTKKTQKHTISDKLTIGYQIFIVSQSDKDTYKLSYSLLINDTTEYMTGSQVLSANHFIIIYSHVSSKASFKVKTNRKQVKQVSETRLKTNCFHK